MLSENAFQLHIQVQTLESKTAEVAVFSKGLEAACRASTLGFLHV